MTPAKPLEHTVMLELDDQKPTLRTDGLLLEAVVAMVAVAAAFLVLADLLGASALRYGAVAWCAGVLALARWSSTSPRFTKTVHYRSMLYRDELDVERRSPDALAGSTRIPRGLAVLHRPRDGVPAGPSCEIQDRAGRLLFRARDRELADRIGGERRTLGDWLAAWFAAEPAATLAAMGTSAPHDPADAPMDPPPAIPGEALA